MESVEVWMWVIAGLIISALILVGGFNMLIKFTQSNHVSTAQDNLILLKSNVDSVCIGGRNSQEIKSYIFPYIVNNITSVHSTFLKRSKLCMEIDKEGRFCHDIDTCNISMPTLDLTREDTLFYKVRKALGSGEATKIEFTIKKTGSKRINISTIERFLK